MSIDKQSIENPPESSAPPDPDIIDLPRRAIGTPQVLAGFIFLLALVMLEVVLFTWDLAVDAQDSARFCDECFANLENEVAMRRQMLIARLEGTEKTLKEHWDDLSEWERTDLQKDAKMQRELISMVEEQDSRRLANRDKDWAKYAAEWRWIVNSGYLALGCFSIIALSLIFGAISLAVSIGTGRKWTWVNIIFLPVIVCAGLFFLYYAMEKDEDNIIPFIVIGILSVPLAIVLRRMVEWIAPVRDESFEGRDSLRRSHLSLACTATLVVTVVMHIFAWMVIIGDFEKEIPYAIRNIANWIVLSIPIGLILAASLLFILKKARKAAFAILAALLALDLIGLGYYYLERVARYWDISSGQWEILLSIPPVLVFFYPLIALAVMLVRPLGKALFRDAASKLAR